MDTTYMANENSCWMCDIVNIQAISSVTTEKNSKTLIATIMDVDSHLVLRTTPIEEKSDIVDLIDNTFSWYGFPGCILVDGDPCFRSRRFKEIMEIWAIKVEVTTKYTERTCMEQWNAFLCNRLKNDISSAVKYDEYHFHLILNSVLQLAKEEFHLIF